MFEDFKRTLGSVCGWIFTIHPRGKKMSAYLLIPGIVLLLLSWFVSFADWLTKPLAYICLIAGAFVAFFFRNPKRQTIFYEDEIACPADGTILSIKTEDDPDVVVIRIFLSIFNVHIQRATMSGYVQNITYTPGTFAFANNPKADKNERNLIEIADGDKVAHEEQITGAIARRIECWVNPAERLFAGQHIGMIYFGSQVAVYLPKDKVRITVKEGQSVQGAITVLGVWI